VNTSLLWSSAATSVGSCLLALSVAACSQSEAQPPRTQVAAAAAPAKPSDGARGGGGDDSDEGVLVVANEVVAACPNLEREAEAARRVDPEIVWVAILSGISDCMNSGSLKDRHLLVAGDAEHRDIVRLVMAAKGAPMDRVVTRDRSGTAPCHAKAPGDCPADPRVDIVLLPKREP
jgi:hypothetical protein